MSLPIVKCSVPHCEYQTDDLDANVVAALLTTHATVHSAAAGGVVWTKVERVKLPTIASAGSSKDLTYFVSRWKDYVQATKYDQQIKFLEDIISRIQTNEDQLKTLRDQIRESFGTSLGTEGMPESSANLLKQSEISKAEQKKDPQTVLEELFKEISTKEREEPKQKFLTNIKPPSSNSQRPPSAEDNQSNVAVTQEKEQKMFKEKQKKGFTQFMKRGFDMMFPNMVKKVDERKYKEQKEKQLQDESSVPDQEDEQFVTYTDITNLPPEIFLMDSKWRDLYFTNLPPEILRMDSKSRDLYLKALDEGKTEVHNIRVMVVGHFGVGKTTLTKRLLREEVNISDRNSTEGIDVHVKRCSVALETGIWKVKSKGLHKDDYSARLTKVVQQVCSTGLTISDTDSSLDVASCNYAGNLVATPDGLDEPELVSFDGGHDDSYSNSEGAGTSMNASLLSQTETSVMDDITLLVQRDNSEDLSNINNYADLSIWDFAGQYAFYGTHQIFLSPQSVYLLVIDLSKTIDSLICDDSCSDTDGENRMNISELIEFWLQSIHFYTEKEGMVILVATHADKLPQEGRSENVNTFFKELRSHLSDKPYCVCLSTYEFDIDNSMVDPNLKDLKTAIFDVAKSNKSHWGKLYPAKWLTLERRLHEMRQKAVKIIERDKLEQVNRSLCVPLKGDELDLFLRFQHACGLLLYFSEQELKDYVILDPQWLIDAFKCFITADMFKQKDMKMLPLWNSFKGNAILTQEFIDLSWSKDGMFSDHKEHLLRLMEKLNIIAKPVTYGEHEITDLRVSRISEGSYFTPCMLKKKTPRSLLYTKQIPNSNSTHRLCYTFVSGQASGFVPPSIFHRLIAACMSTWQPRMTKEKNKTKYLLFCDSGVFDLDSSRIHTLTLYLRDNFIQMWVTSYSQNQPNDNIKARKQVECFLQKLYSNFSKMDMKTYIKCPLTDCCSSDGMIELSLLSDKLEYCCSMHDERSADQNHTILSADVLCDWTVVDRPKVLGEGVGDHVDGPNQKCQFKKTRDETLSQIVVDILNNGMKSVGCLNTPFGRGTAFRVGDRFVITASHILHKVTCNMYTENRPNFDQRISIPCVYVHFNECLDHPFQVIYRLKSPRFSDSGLDVAILEIEDSTSFLPPRLPLSKTEGPKSTVSIIGYGHPMTNSKHLDPNCPVLAAKSSRVVEAIYKVGSEIGTIRQNLKYPDIVNTSFEGYDHPSSFLLDCFLEHGGSGSPAIDHMVPAFTKVVGIYIKGFPSFFFDLPEQMQNDYRDVFRFEMCTRTSSLYSVLEASDKELTNNIFG